MLRLTTVRSREPRLQGRARGGPSSRAKNVVAPQDHGELREVGGGRVVRGRVEPDRVREVRVAQPELRARRRSSRARTRCASRTRRPRAPSPRRCRSASSSAAHEVAHGHALARPQPDLRLDRRRAVARRPERRRRGRRARASAARSSSSSSTRSDAVVRVALVGDAWPVLASMTIADFAPRSCRADWAARADGATSSRRRGERRGERGGGSLAQPQPLTRAQPCGSTSGFSSSSWSTGTPALRDRAERVARPHACRSSASWLVFVVRVVVAVGGRRRRGRPSRPSVVVLDDDASTATRTGQQDERRQKARGTTDVIRPRSIRPAMAAGRVTHSAHAAARRRSASARAGRPPGAPPDRARARARCCARR